MSSVAWLFMMRVAVIWQMSSRCPLSTIIMLTSAACACVPYMYQHRTARLSQLLYGVWLWTYASRQYHSQVLTWQR